ncbi:MAG: ribbon-helix-helix domain-containing protein [Propionibacteriaceae bacterium]|nr:ribbon-helix-helix domain-containing protein [Propionibacteriaceae bacterium]
MRLAAGRPPVGAARGPSPVVRARVPQALKDRVLALATLEGRDESDIVREAVASYVALRQAS